MEQCGIKDTANSPAAVNNTIEIRKVNSAATPNQKNKPLRA